MGPFGKIADKFSGLVDVIMPLNDEYDEEFDEIEEELAEKKQQKKQAVAKNSSRSAVTGVSYTEEYKVSNGESVRVERPSYSREAGVFRQKKSQPQLTVHTTKQPQLKMQIYAPRNFEQVTAIADDLKAGKACVVNYEQIEAMEQRRICEILIENPRTAIRKIASTLDVRPRTVEKQIAALKTKGVLVREGGTRGFWKVTLRKEG